MHIISTMDLGQLAERMGDQATESDARAMRDLLVARHYGLTLDHISEREWQSMLNASAGTVSRADIRALRDEAAVADDDEQVRLCEAALSGDETARAKCERVIRSARIAAQ